MKKVFARFAFGFAALGMLLTSGILAGKVQDVLDPFVDPIEYETPVAEVYKEPLYTDEEPVTVDVKKVIIHYYNTDKKNPTRQIYTWTNGADSKNNDLIADSDDTTGFYHHIELDLEGADTAYAGKTFLNFIVKYKGTWTGQSVDCLLDYTIYQPKNGVVEVWTCPGQKGAVEIYETKEETQLARVSLAYLTNWKTIHVIADEKPTKYRLYGFDKAYLITNEIRQARLKASRLIKEGVPGGAQFDIKFNYNAHINVQYYLETEYASHTKVQSIIVTCDKLYEETNFVKYYSSYKGDDLGCTWTPEQTTFKVWAPTAGAVILNVYRKGTPYNVLKTGSNSCTSYVMTMQPQGIWEKTLLTPDKSSNLDGKYYTYTVYNSEGINEVVDPYAHSAGVNGKRGMILDFSRTNPEGWDNLPLKWDGTERDIKTPQELSIYEVHIRDLTEDKTWNNGEQGGTYQAFAKSNTRYKSFKTGFDHIEEMNINTVQIMPTFDHDNAELKFYYKRDEQGKKTAEQVYVPANYDGEYKDELELEYNWGYNPLNYNVLEGSYSSNPEDGAARVKEFKELVYAYANNKNKTRITMDVVYNHVSSVANSNFTKLMPLYYFRFNAAADEYWNGSGCSNEVKTEAPMMRKFIIDSLCWWAKEYKVKGFRFDLMELIDMNTLNQARNALYKIDPDIYMYGEGWKAADSGLVGNGGGASTDNIYNSAKYSATSIFLGGFNNGGRDSIKGGNDGGGGNTRFTWDESGGQPTIGGGTKTYPLDIGAWADGEPVIFVHAWKSDTETKDYKLNDNSKLVLYDGYPNFLLVRMPKGSTSLDWDKKWNQSIDLTVGNGKLTFKDWGTIRTPGRDSFMTSSEGYATQVGQMATGYNCFSSVHTQDPRQTVNYASCHDNFTLYDQLSWGLGTNPSTETTSGAPSTGKIMNAVAATERAVALSNGVAFVLGGDELLRTKVEDNPAASRENEDYVKMYGTYISHNSYKSSIKCNAFKWDRKDKVQGYVGASVTNTAWSKIAEALGIRNKFTKFASYSNSTASGNDCNYWGAAGASVSWYLGGYVMSANGGGNCSTSATKA